MSIKLLTVALPTGAAVALAVATLVSVEPDTATAALPRNCTTTACSKQDVALATGHGLVVKARRPDRIARSPIASFPSVFSQGRKVWVSYSLAEDLPGVERRFQTLLSTDGGKTFTKTDHEVNFENAISTPSGSFAFSEAANTYPDRMTAKMWGWRGADWTPYTGTMHFRTQPKRGGGATFNHGILKDGQRLLAPYYGRFKGDVRGAKTNRIEIASSTDGGYTWRTRGTVMRPKKRTSGNIVSYSEASMVRLSKHKIMLVARNELYTRDGKRVSYLPLVYSISHDGGRTWGKEKTLLLNGKKAVYGGRPSVLRLRNGVFVLAVGRPDNVFAFSKSRRRDGSPAWSGKLLAYRNYAEKKMAGGYVYRMSGSSGYPAIASVSRSRVIGIFDNCAATWGCNPPKTGFTLNDAPAIKRRFVDTRVP